MIRNVCQGDVYRNPQIFIKKDTKNFTLLDLVPANLEFFNIEEKAEKSGGQLATLFDFFFDSPVVVFSSVYFSSIYQDLTFLHAL